MQIEQFTYSNDNLGYLLFSDTEGLAVDAGAADDIVGFAQKKGIRITHVTNTHTHQDHVCGNRQILEKTGAAFLPCGDLTAGQKISLDHEAVEVLVTPGHSHDSVCFAADGFLVTGDTLFNGTVGNCFTGDLDTFFTSIRTLLAYPGHYQVYAGHDYVRESMDIAGRIDPDNTDIDAYLAAYDPKRVVSTLADELRVNPYIRYNATSIVRQLQHRNVPCQTEAERFKSIMELF